MNKVIYEKIYPAMSSLVNAHGYSCLGLEFVQEDGLDILRIYIENNSGVNLLDCESVSRDVSQYLDTIENLFPQQYLLEVTSPGLERPLFTEQDFINYIGHIADITLINSQNVVGKIIDANNSIVRLQTETETLEFSYEKIKSAHLVFTLEKGEKKTFKKNNKRKK